MYIGKLSELTGASRKAIRHYESMGLIPAPDRKGKYRIYSDKDVMLIRLIRRAQEVGFNLAELKEIVALKARQNRFPLDMANNLIAGKREKLRDSMSELLSLDQRLIALQDELNRTFG